MCNDSSGPRRVKSMFVAQEVDTVEVINNLVESLKKFAISQIIIIGQYYNGDKHSLAFL